MTSFAFFLNTGGTSMERMPPSSEDSAFGFVGWALLGTMSGGFTTGGGAGLGDGFCATVFGGTVFGGTLEAAGFADATWAAGFTVCAGDGFAGTATMAFLPPYCEVIVSTEP